MENFLSLLPIKNGEAAAEAHKNFNFQIICSEDKSEKISSNLSKKLLPLAIAQIPLGGLFSGISVKAYRYFVHEARVEIQNSLQNKHLIHY